LRLTRDTAEKRIHRADHEQRGFLRFAFNLDGNDASSYNLMVNRDKLSVELAAKLITGVAMSKEIKECSQVAGVSKVEDNVAVVSLFVD
jgi:cytidylate kinase